MNEERAKRFVPVDVLKGDRQFGAPDLIESRFVFQESVNGVGGESQIEIEKAQDDFIYLLLKPFDMARRRPHGSVSPPPRRREDPQYEREAPGGST